MSMVIPKELCLGSLIVFIPWVGLLDVTILALPQSVSRLDHSRQVFQLKDYVPPDVPPIPRGRLPGGGPRAYVPPADSRIPDQDHSGGGVRGCGDEIVAIAPRLSVMGRTGSTHPTLVWHSQSDDHEFLELQLYRYRSGNGNIFEEVLIEPIEATAGTQGYMSYTLPQDEPGLQVGETYLWQVVQYCDPNFEEVGMVTSADIEVVPIPAEMTSELSGDSVDNARVFAKFGLWYEAITAVYDANTPAAESLRQDLLHDLLTIEANTESDETEEIVEQLSELVDMP